MVKAFIPSHCTRWACSRRSSRPKMPLFFTKILFRMNGELRRSLICRIRPRSSLFYGRDLSTPRNRIIMDRSPPFPSNYWDSISYLRNCSQPRLHLPRNRDFLQFPLTSFLASSFFSGTSRNRAGRKEIVSTYKKNICSHVVGILEAKLPGRLPPCVEILLMISSSFPPARSLLGI